MNENEGKIIAIISEVFGMDKKEVTRDKRFVKDFKAKSIKIIRNRVPLLEDEFDIEINMEDARKNATVGEAIDYTMKLITARK